MRIESGNRTSSVSRANANARSGAGPAFVPAGADAPAAPAHAAPLAPMAGLDAILALQAVGGPLEGRRRVVRRGRSLLDLLDGMKADLLVGHMDAERIDHLVLQLATLREQTDPALEAVIDEIELRAKVELAKLGRFP